MDELLSEFLAECLDGLAALEAELLGLEARPDDPGRVASIFRAVHTIKGTCGFLGLPRLGRVVHAVEGVLVRIREGRLAPTRATVSALLAALDRVRLILDGLAATRHEPAGDDGELLSALERVAAGAPDAAERAVDPPLVGGGAAEGMAPRTLRVRLDLVERLEGLAGELALARDQLLRAARQSPGGEIPVPLRRLSRVTARLREAVTSARMQPIACAWGRLPRLVRDLGLQLGKRVELQLHGGDTELDRETLEAIRDPLIHVARNAVDHGIEPPEERRARGKPERGLLRLTASRDGGHVAIRVADDGRGLDTAAIGAMALANGLAEEAELAAMGPGGIHRFAFHPGLSTAARVGSVSGRGVGMDVVRANLERIGGTVELASEPGRGTSLTLRIPLARPVVSVLVVAAGGQRLGVPRPAVAEVVRAGGGSARRIEVVEGAPILRLRDRLVPLVSLARALGLPAEPVDPAQPSRVVVATAGGRALGLLVEQVFDAEEVVVEPLAPALRGRGSFSGAAVLGDGGAIAILDLHALSGTSADVAAPGCPASPGGRGAPTPAAHPRGRGPRGSRASDRARRGAALVPSPAEPRRGARPGGRTSRPRRTPRPLRRKRRGPPPAPRP